METNNETLDVKTRAYFLQQGQRIQKIHSILDSNILAHHLKKWFSLLVELALYLLFALTILGAICLPVNPFETSISIDDSTRINIELHKDDIVALFITAKILLVVFCLPILGMALLLGRNRRKNALIREASEEAEQMKEAFDKAIVELKL
jgi:hypothetical protein